VQVYIPVGRRWVRVDHRGNAGSRGGGAGDLLVIVGPATPPQAAGVGIIRMSVRWLAAYLGEFKC
jgi:hypothetical protein